MKHKHSEILHAIADGVPVQFKDIVYKEWRDFNKETHRPPMETDPTDYWRIKPAHYNTGFGPEAGYSKTAAEVPQWRKDMAQAIKDGKVVEVELINDWFEISKSKVESLKTNLLNPDFEVFANLRIRPEPDVVKYFVALKSSGRLSQSKVSNLKLTFDANGNLKDSEVLR
jgi:hypothetical protein